MPTYYQSFKSSWITYLINKTRNFKTFDPHILRIIWFCFHSFYFQYIGMPTTNSQNGIFKFLTTYCQSLKTSLIYYLIIKTRNFKTFGQLILRIIWFSIEFFNFWYTGIPRTNVQTGTLNIMPTYSQLFKSSGITYLINKTRNFKTFEPLIVRIRGF